MSEPLSMEVRVESAAVESVRSGSATADPGGSFVELDFEAPRGLASPHLQSVLSSSAPRRLLVERQARVLREASRSRILECGDGIRLEARISRHPAGGRRPVAIGLHGWHGCADSLYLLSSMTRLYRAGFDIVRLHLRDHGGTHGLNPELFHSCRLDEAVAATGVVREMFPRRPLALLGFSLGGNFALRIGREAPAAGIDIDQVLAVCPVLDPAETMTALDSGWIGYRLYFMRRWRNSMLAKERSFPERYDFGATRTIRSLSGMTDWFVDHHTGFESTDHYLTGYTLTGRYLEGLEVPSAIVSALDDPVIPSAGLARLAASPALEVAATRQGGHCGFMSDYALTSWMDEEVARRLLPLAG